MIAGVPFQMIGELREKGLGPDGKREDANIFVPLTTAVRRLFNVDGLTHLLVQTRGFRDMASAEQSTAAVLRRSRILTWNGATISKSWFW